MKTLDEQLEESAIADWHFYMENIYDLFAVGHQTPEEVYMMFGDYGKYDMKTGLLKDK